jgi:CelD/BcsL family acetyltransferase involved in cellulose biosynthesis
MNTLSISLFKTFSSDLKIKWDELERNFGWSPFQNFCWLSSWYNEIGRFSNIEPRIILIEKDKHVVAILPLAIRIKVKIRILEWLGGIYADYKGPIINSQDNNFVLNFEDNWNSILNLLGRIDLIYFDRQPMYLNEVYNPFYANFSSYADIKSYKMKLASPWEEFLNSKLKKKQQADSNRQIRRLNDLGVLKYIVSDKLDLSKAIVDKMIEYKRIRYKETNSFDFLKFEKNRNFFKSLTAIDDQSIRIHFSALVMDGKIISTHVGIIWSDCFYYLMPSNESNIYKSYSTGRLLLEELVKNSINTGIKYFDFTVGAEEYKKIWCESETQLFYLIEGHTILGDIYCRFLLALRKVVRNRFLKHVKNRVFHFFNK